MKRTLSLLAAMFTLGIVFLVASPAESSAQRPGSVTTEPTHKKGDPCEDKSESSVKKTPWKVSEIGFLTETNTPVDTAQIVAAAAQLGNALGGKLGNYQAVVDTVKGWMTAGSFVGYLQATRTVTATIREWKCKDGVLTLVRDETKTWEEKSPWFRFGPFTWNDITVKKLRALIEKGMSGLPQE